MEHQPGSPPARAARPHAAPGDLLTPLRRSWLDVAAQVLPRDASLVELLTDRLGALSAKATVPAEAELLTVAEEAAQYAVGSASSEDARELSKRLRRAIYEYLLSLDVVLAVAAPTPELLPEARGSDDAVTAAEWRARRDGRPELVWDEPALRVLDGGAEGVAEATTPPAVPIGPPSALAGAAAPPSEVEAAFSSPSDAEATGDVQGGDGVETDPDVAGSREDAKADAGVWEAGWTGEPADEGEDETAPADESPLLILGDHDAQEGPAGQTTTRIGAEALRVPEQFRRDIVVPSVLPGPLVVLPSAGPPDALEPEPPAARHKAGLPREPDAELPAVPSVEPPGEPEPAAVVVLPAADSPRAHEPVPPVVLLETEVPRPQEPALVVPSYRAWADVLASGATDEPEATRPTAAPPIPFTRQRPLRGLAARVSAGRAAQTAATSHDRSAAASAHTDPRPATARDRRHGRIDAEPAPGVEAAATAATLDATPEPDATIDRPHRSAARLRDAGASGMQDEAPGAPEAAAGSPVPDDAPAAAQLPVVGDFRTEAPTEDAEPRWAFAAPSTLSRSAEPLVIADPGVGEGAGGPDPVAGAWSPPAEADDVEDPSASVSEASAPSTSEADSWLTPAVDAADDEPDAAATWPGAAWPGAAGDADDVIVEAGHWPASSPPHGWEGLQSWPTVSAPANRAPRPAPEDPASEKEPRSARGTAEPKPGLATDESDPAWSVRRSPRQQALQQRMALRRREEVIHAAAAFDESASARPRRDRLPDLVIGRLPEQIEELLRRKRTGEAASLVQRAAQEVGGRKIADLALECGDQCRARHQARAAINSYLAAWRADPVYEAPLWRLAETCIADKEVELAVGYLERIADLMRARGDDQGAIGVYRKVISVSPERGDVRALLQTAETLGRFPD